MDKIENGIKELKIIKIKDLLKKDLKIPEYQRPYKWTLKNINQLIDDILNFKDKSAYRLGTIVIHNNKDSLDIVDGQQRITTLILIFKAILRDTTLQAKFKELIQELPNLEYKNSISIKNIQQNFQEINKRTKQIEFDEHIVYFLLERCEVVYIELDNITESFQFFDSQNARGKDLAPHDLLKAYHLREMQNISEYEKKKLVQEWENLDDENKLSELFNNYLYKIRNWSRAKSARYFTKNDVDIFKGISINNNTKELYPFAMLYQMANVFVEEYNSHSSRKVDFNTITYPFSLDLPILNGKRFFEMISHYNNSITKIQSKQNNETIELINNYEGNYRTGDKYVKLLFECALIYYIDKFGEKELDKVIDKLFIWAYTLRLKLKAVQLASIDNRALETDIFKTIKDANEHQEVVNIHIPILDKINYYKRDKVKEKFKNLGYFNDSK